MSQTICLLIGFAFGAFFAWSICRQGKGGMPPADEWIEKEYFDVKASEEGFEVMTH